MSADDVTQINAPFPQGGDLHLRVAVGACRLRIRPGTGEQWVTGTYSSPSGALPARIVHEGGTLRIEQRSVSGITGLMSGIPQFDLAFGKGRRYRLSIDSGASENDLDLGGLPISQMSLNQGAGRTTLTFSSMNPEEMESIDIGAGAGSMEILRLANSRAGTITIGGGAAAFMLEFGGLLRRESSAKISTGMASVDLRLPSYTAAQVTSDSFLGHVQVGDGFTKKQGAYCTPRAVEGGSPVLTIHATVALGMLSLRLIEEASIPDLHPAMATT